MLQGFIFLGHMEELGGEVASAFTNAVNATVVQVCLHEYCHHSISEAQLTWTLQALDINTHICHNVMLFGILQH